MKQLSDKRRQRQAEAKALRDKLIADTGECMICGNDYLRRMPPLNQLCCHEILNGPLRQRVLAEPSCLIVCCWYCNGEELDHKGRWPLARQLAVIKVKSPDRYDRERVLYLRHSNAPNFVTEDEVDAWIIREDARK